ncbi:hypothetical protein LXT21_20250 [Myxococcus sp. K38C18041901]|uniref:hypothetical protein n=1 Tax=Myxococcus guangdongensis TaxID=2906760 RepID=UPI0020A7E6D9|nr:hypothetical protein [Myxococcus guangdongensis]MCP3061116.1 hypothetical protein [Myxococcus guangdongensis]
MSVPAVPKPPRRRHPGAVLATAVLLIGAAPAPTKELVLGSAESTPGLEAVAMPCKQGQRALRVRGGAAKRTATLSAPYDALTCDVTKATEGGWDWGGGEESTSWNLRVRAVDLPGGPTALLITHQGGFEHVHRQHALFVADEQGVKRAWEGSEGMGPSSSSVEAQDGRLLFSRTLDLGGGAQADSWALSELRWDAERKKVVERPAEAWAVILRTADSVSDARAAETPLEAACQGTSLLTVDTHDFRRLTRDKWAVASFHPSRQGAEAVLERLRACAPGAYLRRVQ